MSLRHVLLVYLGSGAASGYDIVKGFQKTYGHLWNATYQQVYRDLNQLRDDGLVEQEVVPSGNRPPRKVYRLNDAGRAELRRFVTTPAKLPRFNDAFLVKIASAHLFERAPLLAELREQRSAYERYLADLERYEAFFRALPEAAQETVYGAYLALARGLSMTRSWLAWSHDVEAWLERTADAKPLTTSPPGVGAFA